MTLFHIWFNLTTQQSCSKTIVPFPVEPVRPMPQSAYLAILRQQPTIPYSISTVAIRSVQVGPIRPTALIVLLAIRYV